jgi:hypothetical protein
MDDIKGEVMTMEFIKTGVTSWKSGYYTIRFYEYSSDKGRYKKNPHYRAYFWGDSFDGRMEYLSLISAIQACKEHEKTC